MNDLMKKSFIFPVLTAEFIAVYETRVEAGIEGDLEPFLAWSLPDDDSSAIERRSYRLRGSYAQKRSCDGLTVPRKKKRKSSKKVRSTIEKRSADPAGETLAVDTPIEPSADTALEGLANDIPSSNIDTNLAGCVVGEGFNKASSTEIMSASASSEATTGSPQSSSQSSAPNATLHTSVTERSSPESFSVTENVQIVNQTAPLVPCPLSFVSDLLNPCDARRVMTAVLLHCVRQCHATGTFAGQTFPLTTTTNTTKIRAFTKQLASVSYDDAVRNIAKRKAGQVGSGMQIDYDENIYWDVISKGAKLLDPTKLPAAKGPYDGFSMAEKIATCEFMDKIGLGTSTENQRQCRGFWKTLSEIQKAGIEYITCYRDAEFNKYCKAYPKSSENSLVDVMVSWEKVYRPRLEPLESRILAQRNGDLSGRSRLKQKHVTERLDIAESSWNDASNEWHSTDEEDAFKLTTTFRATSSKSVSQLVNDHANTERCWNKSIFISLEPRDDGLLTVCPVIPVFLGDFLGIFSGKVWFSEDVKIIQAIPGPTTKLWLDYSEVSGTLNQMPVAKPGGDSNVRLEWEAVNEKDETGPCVSWRVLVLATKQIMPFEQLICAAPRNDQFLLH